MPTTWATWLNGARTVIFAMENQRPPRFLGNPHVNHALLSDPADGLAPGVAAQTLLPSTLKTVSASGSYSFRGSITRPGDPLCTLRGQGRPCTTQHSVPAGCQPLPGRLSSCRVPSEAFSRVLPHMTPHSSRLNLAHFQQNRPIRVIRSHPIAAGPECIADIRGGRLSIDPVGAVRGGKIGFGRIRIGL